MRAAETSVGNAFEWWSWEDEDKLTLQVVLKPVCCKLSPTQSKRVLHHLCSPPAGEWLLWALLNLGDLGTTRACYKSFQRAARQNPFTEKNNHVSTASCMRPEWTHADTLSFIWWKLKYLRPVIQFSLLLPHGDRFRERWRGDIKTFHVIVIAHLKQSLLILDPRPRVLSQPCHF